MNSNNLDFHRAEQAYFARSTDEKIYGNASSGGISTAIACSFIRNGGVVYAASMDSERREVNHIRIDRPENIYQTQGSKYVQSNISKSIYVSVEQDIRNKIPVLFIGTPCQVAAVKNNSELFFSIDLICHGTPGKKVFQDYMDMVTNGRTVSDIRFRNKKSYCICFVDMAKKNKMLSLTPYTSLYYHGFMSGSIYRQSCHQCQYTRHERVADITLGDTDYSEDGDVFNSVIIYSEKGKYLFSQLTDVHSVATDLNSMLDAHAQLNFPVPVNKEQKRFMRLCTKKSIKYALIHMNLKKTLVVAARHFLYCVTQSVRYK